MVESHLRSDLSRRRDFVSVFHIPDITEVFVVVKAISVLVSTNRSLLGFEKKNVLKGKSVRLI